MLTTLPTKRTFVLIGPGCGSACSIFAAALGAANQSVWLVGAPTQACAGIFVSSGFVNPTQRSDDQTLFSQFPVQAVAISEPGLNHDLISFGGLRAHLLENRPVNPMIPLALSIQDVDVPYSGFQKRIVNLVRMYGDF